MDCPVCGKQTRYTRFQENTWFTIFSIRIARLARVADYCQCSICGTSYIPGQLDKPSCIAPVRRVLVYIMMGYGKQQYVDTLCELSERIVHYTPTRQEIDAEMAAVATSATSSAHDDDIFNALRRYAFHLNIQGKQKVIEAAFMMTYVCCEIEHEDRLRVNLIANAMGVAPAFTELVINGIRADGYYGIKRRLAVSS